MRYDQTAPRAGSRLAVSNLFDVNYASTYNEPDDPLDRRDDRQCPLSLPGAAGRSRSAGTTGSKGVPEDDETARHAAPLDGGLIGLVLALMGLSGTILLYEHLWIGVPGTGDPLRGDLATVAAPPKS